LIKKITQLTAQVCCLFYFLLHSRCFQGKVEWVFKWAFLKKRFFLVGSNYISNYFGISQLVEMTRKSVLR